MTPQQILADLRDIHLPEIEAGAGSGDLVLWPLVLVLAAALIIFWLMLRRRTLWRRDVLGDLERIENAAKTGQQKDGWADLAILLKRFAIQRQGRAKVARLSGEAWLQQLDELFGGDHFTNGPGRSLISFPYQISSVIGDEQEKGSDDLRATIDLIRRHLPRYGLAG